MIMSTHRYNKIKRYKILSQVAFSILNGGDVPYFQMQW